MRQSWNHNLTKANIYSKKLLRSRFPKKKLVPVSIWRRWLWKRKCRYLHRAKDNLFFNKKVQRFWRKQVNHVRRNPYNYKVKAAFASGFFRRTKALPKFLPAIGPQKYSIIISGKKAVLSSLRSANLFNGYQKFSVHTPQRSMSIVHNSSAKKLSLSEYHWLNLLSGGKHLGETVYNLVGYNRSTFKTRRKYLKLRLSKKNYDMLEEIKTGNVLQLKQKLRSDKHVVDAAKTKAYMLRFKEASWKLRYRKFFMVVGQHISSVRQLCKFINAFHFLNRNFVLKLPLLSISSNGLTGYKARTFLTQLLENYPSLQTSSRFLYDNRRDYEQESVLVGLDLSSNFNAVHFSAERYYRAVRLYFYIDSGFRKLTANGNVNINIHNTKVLRIKRIAKSLFLEVSLQTSLNKSSTFAINYRLVNSISFNINPVGAVETLYLQPRVKHARFKVFKRANYWVSNNNKNPCKKQRLNTFEYGYGISYWRQPYRLMKKVRYKAFIYKAFFRKQFYFARSYHRLKRARVKKQRMLNPRFRFISLTKPLIINVVKTVYSNISQISAVCAFAEKYYFALPSVLRVYGSSSKFIKLKNNVLVNAGVNRASILNFDKIRVSGRFRLYMSETLRHRYGWASEENVDRLKWFRKRFKRWFGKFRRIKKHKAFSSLFRSYFEQLTGYKEKQMMYLWYNFRRGLDSYHSGGANVVRMFSQSLLLNPSQLLLFLGLAPSRYTAKMLSQRGALVINGIVSTKFWFGIKPMDILQITPYIWEFVRQMYGSHRWQKLQLKLSMLNFLQTDWRMLMITFVRWPYRFELISPRFLSERWIRYHIRRFPARDRSFRKVKLVWKKYN